MEISNKLQSGNKSCKKSRCVTDLGKFKAIKEDKLVTKVAKNQDLLPV